MATVVSPSAKVRDAAEYINEQLALGGKSLSALIDEAGMRFNLTPLDAEALARIFADAQKKG